MTMTMTLDLPDEQARFDRVVQAAGGHRELKLDVLGCEEGRVLVFISNKYAAASYKLEAGWQDKFQRHLEGGFFG